MNLPRLHIYADGDEVSVCLDYGNGNSDPVISLDFDLGGTRLGRLVSAAYWRFRELAHR